MFENKSILITGGTGSFGHKFIETILEQSKPERIIVYSRDELKQSEMSQKLYKHDDIMRYFIGDVRDLPRLKLAMKDVDIVIHAAALKQVPAAEYNPFECIKTNVIGAQNVIDAALETDVTRIMALSTDKAAAPINLYGATKLCSDKLFVAANNYTGKRDLKISVVRYGNVMGSRGSVIPFFQSLDRASSYPVTDKRMTRFNITLQDGVNFTIDCMQKMWGGEIFIPKIPSYRILDVIEALNPEAAIEEIGIRPGEKLHEEMITDMDALNTIEFDNYFVILPSIELWPVEKFENESSASVGKKCRPGFSYKSNTNPDFLDVKTIQKLIETRM